MRLRQIGLSARITITALVFVMAGGFLWMSEDVDRDQEVYLKERSVSLESALRIEQMHIKQSIDTLRKDALFLANVPPISGIVRASANKGIDPRDNNSYATWEARLQEIFSAFLRAHPEYLQVSYIGAAGEGRELVRVVNNDGRVEVIARDALQNRGNQDYFGAGLMLTAGRVHLSEFSLSRDRGRIEEPPRPEVRAVTTVFDAGGHVFGMVVLNRDVRSMFASASEGVPSGVESYIANQQGQYLLHPDGRRSFSFESGSKENIANDFPLLKPMIESQDSRNDVLHLDMAGGYLAAKRVFFDGSDPSRFLLLAYHLPEKTGAQKFNDFSLSDMGKTLLAMLLASGVFMLILHHTFAPLRRITAAAREIAAGKRDMRLTDDGEGEIGELTEALNAMLDILSDSDHIQRENAFRKELIESLPGIFYMIDMQGRFWMWNHNLEQVLRLSAAELASSHPLDFFEGEDRVNIEKAIRQVFEEGETSVEAELMAKDGSRTPYHFTGRRVEREGVPVLVGLGLDITERRKVQAVQERFKQVIETAMDGFWMTDTEGFLEEVNESYARMSGYTMEELVGMHISQLEAKEQMEDVKEHIDKIMALGHDRFETRHRCKDGRLIDIEVSTTFMPKAGKFFVFSHDITRRKQAEQELRVAAATFETHEAILITDAQANILRVNQAFTEITGYTLEEVAGKNPRIMGSGRQDKAFFEAMWKQVLETGSWAGEIWDRRKNGEIYPKWMNITAVKNERGETLQYVSIFSDYTERKKAEEEIRSLAFYDPLTRLPNRRLFLERFHTALASSARFGDYGAILFIDLDRFKELNDTSGHDYGDLMLVEVAARIRSCVREIDTVARFGGDEFVVLLENVSSRSEEAALTTGVVSEKIRAALSRPYLLKEQEYYSSSSIGICLYRGNDESMEVLLRRADVAMYQAKDAGGDNVRFCDPVLQQNWESAAAKQSREDPDPERLPSA